MNICLIDSDKQDYIKYIHPNVILNRFDLSFGDEYQMIAVQDKDKVLYVPLHIRRKEMTLGIYMRNIDEEIPGAFEKIKNFVFKNFDVDAIVLQHTLTPFDGAEITQHCHVELPDTIEDFDNNLGAWVRRNTKRYPKQINENIGKISFEKIDVSNCPAYVFDLYFKWKYQSHHRHYHMTFQQYIKQFGINTVYVLMAGCEYLAIGFMSETGDNLYFENFSYNQKYKKYSPGMVLYHEIIRDLIAQHKKILYLLSAYDYKINYNGIVTQTYSGCVYKSQDTINKLKQLALRLKKLPKCIRKVVVWLYGNLCLSKTYKHFLKNEVGK